MFHMYLYSCNTIFKVTSATINLNSKYEKRSAHVYLLSVIFIYFQLAVFVMFRKFKGCRDLDINQGCQISLFQDKSVDPITSFRRKES